MASTKAKKHTLLSNALIDGKLVKKGEAVELSKETLEDLASQGAVKVDADEAKAESE